VQDGLGRLLVGEYAACKGQEREEQRRRAHLFCFGIFCIFLFEEGRAWPECALGGFAPGGVWSCERGRAIDSVSLLCVVALGRK
jgi:hypothetical protein